MTSNGERSSWNNEFHFKNSNIFPYTRKFFKKLFKAVCQDSIILIVDFIWKLAATKESNTATSLQGHMTGNREKLNLLGEHILYIMLEKMRELFYPELLEKFWRISMYLTDGAIAKLYVT